MKGTKAKIKSIKLLKKNLILPEEIPLKGVIYFSFFINIIGIVFIFIIRKKFLPPEVPLFYGLPEGENQITSSVNLILPFVSSLTIVSLNTILALIIKDDFNKKTLIIGGFVASLFSLITIIKIVFLIGSFNLN